MSHLGLQAQNACGELASAYSSAFCIGGVSVQVVGARVSDVHLAPSLEPFRVPSGLSDLKIRVEWISKLRSTPGRELFDSGSIWRLFEDSAGFRFDFSTPFLGKNSYKRLLVDTEFRRAWLMLSDECFPNREFAFPLEYPLDELLIMHRLSHEKAIELHGCGILGYGLSGNLFVGHSGAGKSTTARLWTAQHNIQILSDDRIIVRKRGREIVMYGTPWHGEAAFASPGSTPLSRIFILKHGRGNVLTRLSYSQAVAELFSRSFVPFHRHEYVDAALTFLQEVAEAIPCYSYSFEPDAGAVDAILNLND